MVNSSFSEGKPLKNSQSSIRLLNFVKRLLHFHTKLTENDARSDVYFPPTVTIMKIHHHRSLCLLIVICILINDCTSFQNKRVFGHKHVTRTRATSLSDDDDDEILSPLGKLLLKRNDVMGYNADTFPPRDRPEDGQVAKRKMAWPFQVRNINDEPNSSYRFPLFSC